jgi:hypothetical protein
MFPQHNVFSALLLGTLRDALNCLFGGGTPVGGCHESISTDGPTFCDGGTGDRK